MQQSNFGYEVSIAAIIKGSFISTYLIDDKKAIYLKESL